MLAWRRREPRQCPADRNGQNEPGGDFLHAVGTGLADDPATIATVNSEASELASRHLGGVECACRSDGDVGDRGQPRPAPAPPCRPGDVEH